MRSARITAARFAQLVQPLKGLQVSKAWRGFGSATLEAQPQWVLFLPDRSWLCVDVGRVVHRKQEKANRTRARRRAV